MVRIAGHGASQIGMSARVGCSSCTVSNQPHPRSGSSHKVAKSCQRIRSDCSAVNGMPWQSSSATCSCSPPCKTKCRAACLALHRHSSRLTRRNAISGRICCDHATAQELAHGHSNHRRPQFGEFGLVLLSVLHYPPSPTRLPRRPGSASQTWTSRFVVQSLPTAADASAMRQVVRPHSDENTQHRSHAALWARCAFSFVLIMRISAGSQLSRTLSQH